jgi:hypothetical protein
VAGLGEHDRVARLHDLLLGVADEAQLGSLEVEQQAERASAPLGCGPDLGRPALERLCVAVGAVQPRAVHPGRHEAVENARRVGGGSQRRDDLRAPFEHARQCRNS